MDNNTTKMSSKEAADYFGVTTDTLRFYERKGVIPPVHRDKNGYRVFTDVELNWLYLVLNLKRAGLSLEKITDFSQLALSKGPNAKTAQKHLLQEQIDEVDKQLFNLQQTRKVLQWKLDTFDEHLGRIDAGNMDAVDVRKEWQDYKK